MAAHQMGVTRACGLISVSRSLCDYQSRRPDDGPLKERLCDLAAQKRRYGYRRLHVLLLRKGIKVSRKRTYRVCREAGLAVRRRMRKRIAGIEWIPAPIRHAPNISWSMDFVTDGLADERRLLCLNIVDSFTRDCVAIEVESSLIGRRVVDVMKRLADLRELLLSVTTDNRLEFAGKILDEWAYTHGVYNNLIQPGNPRKTAS